MLSFELTPIHKADFYNCVEANVTPFFFFLICYFMLVLFLCILYANYN